MFPRHQDTESFLLAESHYHYVNLYISVEKSGMHDGSTPDLTDG